MTEAPPEEVSYSGPVVAIPVYAGVSELELGLMVSLCRVCAGEEAVKTVNRSRASIVTAGGLVMTPHFIYTTLPSPAALLIPGGSGAARAARDPLLKTFLQTHSQLPSGISGSGLLLAGESGLLENRVLGSPAELLDTIWGYNPTDAKPGEVVQDGALTTTPSGLFALHAAFAIASALWGAEVATGAVERLGGREWKATLTGGSFSHPPNPPSQGDGGS